jgi:hypothetical protein
LPIDNRRPEAAVVHDVKEDTVRQALSSIIAHGRIAGAALLVLVCACSMQRIDDGLLAEVPEDQWENVQAARAAHTEAKDELAKRIVERESAGHRVDIAKADFEVARAELGTSEIRARVVEANGSKMEREIARAVLSQCEAKVNVSDLAIDLRECEFDVARQQETLARKTADLREAEIELAKAQAVQFVDRPAAKAVSLTEYELQVKERETAVALAVQREAEATEFLITARQAYDAAKRAADRLASAPTETADSEE